nr:Coatomer subunit beta-1 [Ipomoea batatas]
MLKPAAAYLVKCFKDIYAWLVNCAHDVHITIAAALASRPDVGSSMKMMDGLATSSTATVNRFLCSVERPSTPGSPTRESLKGFSSTSSITCSMNIYTDRHTQYKSILPLARN